MADRTIQVHDNGSITRAVMSGRRHFDIQTDGTRGKERNIPATRIKVVSASQRTTLTSVVNELISGQNRTQLRHLSDTQGEHVFQLPAAAIPPESSLN